MRSDRPLDTGPRQSSTGDPGLYSWAMPADDPALKSSGARMASGVIRAVCLVATLVVSAVIGTFLILTTDRVPFSGYNVTAADWMIGFVLSGWALGLVGLAWLIAAVMAWRRRHLRTRWLAIPPVFGVIGVVAVVAVSLGSPGGFDSSRLELDEVVTQARSHAPGWTEHYGYDEPRRVGSLDVGSVTHREDGVVVVSDADSGAFFRMSGWAHSPQGLPGFDPGVKALEVNHLEGPWYTYTFVL